MNRFDISLKWTDNKEDTIKATAISDCDCKQYLIDLEADNDHVSKVERQTTRVVRVRYNIWYLEPEMLIFSNATEEDLFCEMMRI